MRISLFRKRLKEWKKREKKEKESRKWLKEGSHLKILILRRNHKSYQRSLKKTIQPPQETPKPRFNKQKPTKTINLQIVSPLEVLLPPSHHIKWVVKTSQIRVIRKIVLVIELLLLKDPRQILHSYTLILTWVMNVRRDW